MRGSYNKRTTPINCLPSTHEANHANGLACMQAIR